MAVLRSLSVRFKQAFGQIENRNTREFLPAALEIVETPASPVARTLAATIILFFLIALIWAFLGKVDILATAAGRIAPQGSTKTIQSSDSGVIQTIRVQNGDYVQPGQVLIELDPTIAKANQDQVDQSLGLVKLESERLSALAAFGRTGQRQDVKNLPGVSPSDWMKARAALSAQMDEQTQNLSNLDQQIQSKQSEHAVVSENVERLKATIPLIEEKERIHRDLTEQGFGTRLSYLEVQQQLAEAKHNLLAEIQRLAAANAEVIALRHQREQARSKFLSDALADLAKARQKQEDLEQELVKANYKHTETALTSPISGIVEDLTVHTLGGVVTPGQHLMSIVPDSSDLVVEAQLANRDVGFVHAGQTVKVKVETFSFTRYGMVEGRVLTVSRDAAPRQEEDARQASPMPQAGSLTYSARISLPQSTMNVDGRREPLRPGMAVTCEIQTGKRTIIDYLLSPISKRAEESLHER